MQITLCYKEYPCKLNLSACKYFYEKTGKDINHVLMKFIASSSSQQKETLLDRFERLFSVESAQTIAYLFHAVTREQNSCLQLHEIEDAMFRVGWIPNNDEDSELCQPWPYVVLDLATQVSDYYAVTKKKADS